MGVKGHPVFARFYERAGAAALAGPLAPRPRGGGMTQEPVIVYWRPRCPYCMRLRWQLRRARLATREVNIWQDPGAAARVRDITGGDETVPTVVIGDLSMVNPSRDQVLAAARARGGQGTAR
ncbi:MAG: glutaredoxin domain-containing protein [Streptosporangiaceae bacterium]